MRLFPGPFSALRCLRLSPSSSPVAVDRTARVERAATVSPRSPLLGGAGLASARCGSVEVPLDRADPAAGTTKVAFALIPRRDARRPRKARCSSTPAAPARDDRQRRRDGEEFAPLLENRDLLLVDPRGTGRSDAAEVRGYAPGPRRRLRRRGRSVQGDRGVRARARRTRADVRQRRRRGRHRGGARQARPPPARPLGQLLRHLSHARLRGSPPRARPLDGPQRRVSDRLRPVGHGPRRRHAPRHRSRLRADAQLSRRRSAARPRRPRDTPARTTRCVQRRRGRPAVPRPHRRGRCSPR